MRSILKKLKFLTSATAVFAKDRSGAAVVEFSIVLPVMLLVFGVGLVVQDAIRMSYLNNKAAYTLSDMVSREDVQIDSPYFDGLNSIYEYLIDYRYPTHLRISTIECTSDCTDATRRILEVCWSKPSSGLSALTTADIAAYNSRTPVLAQGDTLLMTETFLEYTPLLGDAILSSRTYEATTFTRPRIVPQLKFDTGAFDSFGNKLLKDCFNN